MLDRAQGCLLGQLIGDSLGSLVEFRSLEEIHTRYTKGVRELEDGGTYHTIAGQPTDDSEMALMLARTLIERGTYDPDAAREAYIFWLKSGPFDRGHTISSALGGQLLPDSQANGAMMRVSPLGIYGSRFEAAKVAEWAQMDAALTHPNIVCRQANSLYAMAISYAIRTGFDAQSVYQSLLEWADEMKVEPSLMKAVRDAENEPPSDYNTLQGWVLIAFQNALWQLLHAPDFEEGLVDTIMHGGDTDTNAAICGALTGAVCGRKSIPDRWVRTILNCRPEAGRPGVQHPRPECFWPVNALRLAEQLIGEQ
ncbi:MAG: ADP-ribosylglycohydrolase family protein [Candidatus Wallbacteria bacterium]|nr:ADP-ribosylglycohydrolase family protein [Candidatus Wallbacteria bacterium]